nr:winged helix-turn-helix domain-containing protein [Actinomycetota bacterium]
LLAGHVRGAEALLRAVAQHPQAGPPLVAGASLAAGIAQVLGRADGRGDLELSVERCDVLGLGWLASLGRAALCLAEDGSYEDALAVQDARRQAGDQWGAALAGLFAGLGALRAGDPSVQVLSSVADSFRRLDARVLEAWTRAALSIAAARAGAPDARSLAAEAEALTRATGAYGVLALAYTGMAEADPKRSGECSALAAMTHRECGLALPDRVVSLAEDGIAAPVQDGIAAGGPADALEQLAGELSSFDAVFAPFHATLARSRHRSRRGAHALTAGTPASEASLSLRCFGSFALSIGGRPVDATGVKPRARSALHLLAMHAGRPVHREALIEALWPEGDARAATRNLHVAVSTLRGLLEPGNARGEPSIVAREGDAYRLALPADAEVDVLYFERLLAQGRTAQATGDRRRAVAAYQRALDVYRGDLLPEEGPAEWVLSTRERYRAEAVEAARAAAELLLALAEPTRAAHAAHRGLAIDRYRSGLWRLLIRAHELDGDLAAAARTRQVYAEVLAELEIDDPVAFGASPRSQAFVKNSTSLIAQAPSGAGP